MIPRSEKKWFVKIIITQIPEKICFKIAKIARNTMCKDQNMIWSNFGSSVGVRTHD